MRGRFAAFSGLAALALLVGVASRPGSNLSGGPVPPSEPLVVFLQTAFWLGVAVEIVLMAGLVYAFWPQGRRTKREPGDFEWVFEPPPIHWAIKLVMLLFPFLLMAGVVTAIILFRNANAPLLPSGLLPGLPAPSPLPGQPPSISPRVTTEAVLPWIGSGLAALIVASVAAWLLAGRRRSAAWAEPKPASREALADVVEEGLDALRSNPDPRQAVIAAYSAMERALEKAGRPRRPFEAPLEFVARILSSIAGAATAARRLTDLFELAKFSEHEIDEEMRGVAVLALSTIRTELQPSEAE